MDNEIEILAVGQNVIVKPEVVESEQKDWRVSYTGIYGIVEKIDNEGWGYIRFRNGVGEWYKYNELLEDNDDGQ